MPLPRTELTSFGINAEGASASRTHDTWNQISTDEFIEGAGELLDEDKLAGLVMEKVVPLLPNLEGHWHPSGFMVYPLGTHTTYGSLRLHIWPQGLRQIKERGHGLMYSHTLGLIHDADIHNHAWNIASHVYAGYTDKIFRLTPMAEDMSEEVTEGKMLPLDVYRVHRVTYTDDGQVLLQPHRLDRFNTRLEYYDGVGWNTRFSDHERPGNGWVYARLYDDRSHIMAGDLHLIDHGEFHAPSVPYGRFAATLAINSHRIGEGPDVLIRGPVPATSYGRRKVAPEEAELAREQLLSIPSEQEALICPSITAGSVALRDLIEFETRHPRLY